MGLKEKMLTGGDKEVVEAAVRICRGYLNGPWKKITDLDVNVKRLSGGLSNFLYHVKLDGFEGVKPEQVLLRVYGQTHGEGAIESLITESVIFTLLSERKIGPKLYGVFPGGRIEEFIQSNSLTSQQLRDPEMSLAIAEKLAAVHLMNIPINKQPQWIWDTMSRWLVTIEQAEPMEGPDTVLNSIDFKTELQWLKNHLSKIPSPAVFCHNDLQGGNILLQQKSDGSQSLVFIDFEYCSYNYRGFDLANHFIEWTYDYTNKEYPHYTANSENYPSEDSMRLFIEKYLSTMYPDGKINKPEVNNVKTMITEVKHYTLASHLLWCLWSIVNARTSSIPFGYWEYALERFTSYKKLKSQLISSKESLSTKRKVID
ncbi:choline/ethanolamine kinase isoform X1 [Cimex lectularius]|uniref:Choline/ethanolamine kinase n=2 Tax=Cimex lectularius TaxID=79782 RepID=A0A8I6R9C9_CIMLE|nr:choline/ethanolamine kinase isoform X1 [Cimex lectularius]